MFTTKLFLSLFADRQQAAGQRLTNKAPDKNGVKSSKRVSHTHTHTHTHQLILITMNTPETISK